MSELDNWVVWYLYHYPKMSGHPTHWIASSRMRWRRVDQAAYLKLRKPKQGSRKVIQPGRLWLLYQEWGTTCFCLMLPEGVSPEQAGFGGGT